MNSSSSELKAYATKILVAVAIVLVLYGIFYIADLFSSYLYLYEYVPLIWLAFRLFLAAVIIYIGVMMYKIGRVVSKISTSSLRNILSLKKKLSLFVPLMMILCISIPLLISFYASPPLAEYYRPYNGQLIYEDRLAGYYGYGDGIHTCVRITNTIDLQTLFTSAQAHGYNATYKPATIGLSSSEEYCSVLRTSDSIDIYYNRGGNETSFDYAVPTWTLIDCHYKTLEDWFESRLREFFPHLTDEECSDFAKRLASGYHTIKISGSPDWESVKNYLGAFSDVHSVPIGYVFEYYSRGRIGYEIPSVTIKQAMILNDNKSITFIVSANSRGFVTINVGSKYFLNIDWIREIFAKMFFDIGLPTAGIWKFTIVENWIGEWT